MSLIELTCQHQYPPVQKSPGDVGADLRACQSVKLVPREMTVIRTGVFVEHIAPGFWLKLETKSGQAAKGLIVCGGVIDSQYRGEIAVCLHNTQKHQVVVNAGDSICQMVIMPHFEPREHLAVDGDCVALVEAEQRGAKGGVWR